jgi:arylformamidase
MRLYDISIPLRPGLACWPGDVPYQFRWTWRKQDGATVNVGQVALSVHTGTHADAPFHFRDDGATAEALPLEPFVGPARVVDVCGRPGIRREDVEALDLSRTPRILFRTGAWTRHDRFPDRVPVMDGDVPDVLARRGVVLVGVDVPSVDELDSKSLPIHHALGARGIYILESLSLADVPEGAYELCALPLGIVGGDGAPVRAVLRELP